MSRPAGLSDDEDFYDSDLEGFDFEPERRRVIIQPRERSPEEKLFDAIARRNPTEVVAAISAGADIHFRIRDRSAIMEAASEGHPEIIELLIQKGANVIDECNMNTVVMCLCNSWSKDENELLKCLKLLLQHGANPKATSWTLVTPLMLAVKHNHPLLVTHFLEVGCDVNSADCDGYTPIIFAAQSGNATMVKLLVDAGANLAVVDRRGNRLVDIPQVNSDPTLASLLGIEIQDDPVEEDVCYLSSYRRAMLSIPKENDRLYGYNEDAVTFVRGIGLFDIAQILKNNDIQLAELLTWNDDDWKQSGIQISYYTRKIQLAVKNYHEHPWGKNAIPRVDKVVVNDEVDLFVVAQYFMDFLRVMHISSASSLYMLKNSPLNPDSIEDIDKILRYNSRAARQLQHVKQIILSIESSANTMPPDLVTAKHFPEQNSSFYMKCISFVLKLSISWRLPLFSEVSF